MLQLLIVCFGAQGKKCHGLFHLPFTSSQLRCQGMVSVCARVCEYVCVVCVYVMCVVCVHVCGVTVCVFV